MMYWGSVEPTAACKQCSVCKEEYLSCGHLPLWDWGLAVNYGNGNLSQNWWCICDKCCTEFTYAPGRQDRFGAVVAIKNLPVPEVSFCHTVKGLRIGSFSDPSAVGKFLLQLLRNRGRETLCNPRGQPSSITAEERCKMKNERSVK